MTLEDVYTRTDLLTLHNLKPWWETAQSFIIAAVVGLSLFLVYKSDQGALRCLPKRDNDTESFSEPQMMFVNEQCTAEADFFLLNFWWLSMLVAFVMYIVVNFWEHIPQVTNEVSRFRRLFDVVSHFGGSSESLVRFVTTADSPDSPDYERQQRTACRRIVKSFHGPRKASTILEGLLDDVHQDAVRYFHAFPYIELITEWGIQSPVCYAAGVEIMEPITQKTLVVDPAEERLEFLEFCEEDASPILNTLMTQVCRHVSAVESSMARHTRHTTSAILRRIHTNSATWCGDTLIDRSKVDSNDCGSEKAETLVLLLCLRQIETVRKLKEGFSRVLGENAFQAVFDIQADAVTLLEMLRNEAERKTLEKTRHLLPENPREIKEDWRRSADVQAYAEARCKATAVKCDRFENSSTRFGEFITLDSPAVKYKELLAEMISALDNPLILQRLESVRSLPPRKQLNKLLENGGDILVHAEKSLIDSIRIVDAYKQLLALRQIVTISELATKMQHQQRRKTGNHQAPRPSKKSHFNIRNAYFIRNLASLVFAVGAILLYLFGIILGNFDPVFVCGGTYKCIYFSFRTPWVIACAQVAFLAVLCAIFVALLWRFRPLMGDPRSGTDFLLWLCKNSGKTKEVATFKRLRSGVEKNGRAILYGLRKNLTTAALLGDLGFFLFYLDVTDDNIESFLNSNFVKSNRDENVGKTIAMLQRLKVSDWSVGKRRIEDSSNNEPFRRFFVKSLQSNNNNKQNGRNVSKPCQRKNETNATNRFKV